MRSCIDDLVKLVDQVYALEGKRPREVCIQPKDWPELKAACEEYLSVPALPIAPGRVFIYGVEVRIVP